MAEVCSKRATTSEGRTKREWIGRMKGGSQEAQVGFDGLAAIRPGNNELGGPGWPRRSPCVLATMGAWSGRGREGLRVERWWSRSRIRYNTMATVKGKAGSRQTDRQTDSRCLETAQRARRAPTACQMIK
jgi:hypothetical protein